MNVDEWFKDYIHDRHDLFYKIAQGAQINDIIPIYWCPACQKHVEVYDVNSLPRCRLCGTLPQGDHMNDNLIYPIYLYGIDEDEPYGYFEYYETDENLWTLDSNFSECYGSNQKCDRAVINGVEYALNQVYDFHNDIEWRTGTFTTPEECIKHFIQKLCITDNESSIKPIHFRKLNI